MVSEYISETAAMTMNGAALALLLVLAVRVSHLYRKEQRSAPAAPEQDVDSNPENVLRAFAESQLAHIRDELGRFKFWNDDQKTSLVSYYFIGAAEYLGHHEKLSSVERRKLTIELLQNDLGLGAKQVSKIYVGAKMVSTDGNQKNPVKVGARAFRDWLNKGQLSDDCALSSFV